MLLLRINLICPVCGNEYKAYECRIKRGQGKFCSKKCYDEHQKTKVFSEEHRKKISIAKMGHPSPNKGKHPTEETSKKLSESQLGRKSPMEGKKHTNMAKLKMSMYRKGKPSHQKNKTLSLETRLKMSISRMGKNNPQWRGGASYLPYCSAFNCQVKEEIRNKFGRACFMCGLSEVDNKKKLHVHHIDYNKMQGCGKRSWNLVPLCNSCHTRTSHARWHWFNMLYNHWAIRSEVNLGDEDMKFIYREMG